MDYSSENTVTIVFTVTWVNESSVIIHGRRSKADQTVPLYGVKLHMDKFSRTPEHLPEQEPARKTGRSAGDAFADLTELRIRELLFPAYIRPMLNDMAEKVRLLQNENTFSFGFITDTHTEDHIVHHCGSISGASKYIPLSFIAHGGDITDGFLPKPDEFRLIRKAVNRLLEARVPLLYAKGNHDDNNFYGRGARGNAIPDQAENFTKDIELYNQIMKFSEKDITVGSRENLYYYYDDENAKVRVIVWNAFDLPWVDQDGEKLLNSMYNKGLNQNQLKWIATEALDFSSKADSGAWGIILISHYVGTSIKNFDILTGILDAYTSGTTYFASGSFTHDDHRTKTTLTFPYAVSADFTGQTPGEVIAFISGDTHRDRMSTINGYLSIECLNASLAKDHESAPVKTNFTRTETAWDIFTVDRVNRAINMTRFGAGEDRATRY